MSLPFQTNYIMKIQRIPPLQPCVRQPSALSGFRSAVFWCRSDGSTPYTLTLQRLQVFQFRSFKITAFSKHFKLFQSKKPASALKEVAGFFTFLVLNDVTVQLFNGSTSSFATFACLV
jgi:hypothetical protein